MKETGYGEHIWEPVVPKKKIETITISTKRTSGIHGAILEHKRVNDLEKKYLDAKINLPENLLGAIYERNKSEKENTRIEKEIKRIYREEKNPNEEENSPLGLLKRELWELKERMSDIDHNISEIIGEDKDLYERYNEFENIKSERKKLLKINPKLN